MPQLWQCDDCGARYRVNWLSHCYRCEGAPPKAKPKPEKQSKPRRGRMPRIVAGVGASNGDEPQPELSNAVTPREEYEEMVQALAPEPEPAAPAVEPIEVAVQLPADEVLPLVQDAVLKPPTGGVA